MQLVVHSSGRVRCLYGETVDLAALGTLHVERASHVEPDAHGRWTADLRPVGGPLLGPFTLRSAAVICGLAKPVDDVVCSQPRPTTGSAVAKRRRSSRNAWPKPSGQPMAGRARLT